MWIKPLILGSIVWLLAGEVPPPPAGDDVAAQIQRQTQELLDAITTGSAEVWERYLDSSVANTTEDWTRSRG